MIDGMTGLEAGVNLHTVSEAEAATLEVVAPSGSRSGRVMFRDGRNSYYVQRRGA